MKHAATIRRKHRGEEGYAMVLMIFFLALLVLSTVMAAPTVLSSIQREKEAEMVWRGRQYTRGIRMYYVKMHKFPTSLDDLTQPKTGLRFMRQAYKDPMNGVDGTWRLIYVGPNGQLIGSLNSQMLGTQLPTGGGPGMAQNASFGGTSSFGGNNSFGSNNSIGGGNSSFGSTLGGNSSSFGSSFGSTGFGNTGFGNGNQAGAAPVGQAPTNANGVDSGNNGGNPNDPNAQNGDSSDQGGTPQSQGMMDASNTIGGNIIGVGSKVNKKSFLWYKKAKNYRLFEFIWDPTKDTVVGGASQGIGAPVQGTNGVNPNGANPNGTGVNGVTSSPFSPGINGNQNSQQNQNPGNPNNGIVDPNSNPPLQAPPNPPNQ
jgi:hypothetical protein